MSLKAKESCRCDGDGRASSNALGCGIWLSSTTTADFQPLAHSGGRAGSSGTSIVGKFDI